MVGLAPSHQMLLMAGHTEIPLPKTSKLQPSIISGFCELSRPLFIVFLSFDKKTISDYENLFIL
jgi:hypothetical protein